MDSSTLGSWFTQGGALANSALFIALFCALMAIFALLRQYQGHPKAGTFARVFIVIGVLSLMVARLAPQETKALATANQDIAVQKQMLTQKLEELGPDDLEKALNEGESIVESDEHSDEAFLNEEEDIAREEFNEELGALHNEEDMLDDAIHKAEDELDSTTHDIYDDMVTINDNADNALNNALNTITEGTLTLPAAQSPEMAAENTIEHEDAPEEAMAVLPIVAKIHGVHHAQWNQSMLPYLQLDVSANVNPESALPLLSELCKTLIEHKLDPSSVSIKDLEGGHIARQMCDMLTQSVE